MTDALSAADVTGLLVQWSRGDPEALERLMPAIYAECRRIAARQSLLGGWRSGFR